jgi:hypothetical protein
MHLYIVIAAFILAGVAPFMDDYSKRDANYAQEDEIELSDAAESESEEA